MSMCVHTYVHAYISMLSKNSVKLYIFLYLIVFI